MGNDIFCVGDFYRSIPWCFYDENTNYVLIAELLHCCIAVIYPKSPKDLKALNNPNNHLYAWNLQISKLSSYN